MKHFKEFILEMSSPKFDLKKAFNYYKLFGIVTDKPFETVRKNIKDMKVHSHIEINLEKEDDLETTLNQIIQNSVEVICWITTKNVDVLNDKLFYNALIKGNYKGKDIPAETQILYVTSEDILPKQIQNELTPFIKI